MYSHVVIDVRYRWNTSLWEPHNMDSAANRTGTNSVHNSLKHSIRRRTFRYSQVYNATYIYCVISCTYMLIRSRCCKNSHQGQRKKIIPKVHIRQESHIHPENFKSLAIIVWAGHRRRRKLKTKQARKKGTRLQQLLYIVHVWYIYIQQDNNIGHERRIYL